MWISQAMSCCVIGRNTIVLDIDKDKYFALPEHLSETFRDCVESDAVPGAAACSDLIRLRDLGLLSLLDRERNYPPATCDFEGLPTRSASPLQVAEVMALKMQSAWLVKHRAFAVNIDQLRRLKATHNGVDYDITHASAVLNAFKASRNLSSDNDRCLSLSIAAFKALLARHIDVDLVIGVSLPFAAHCWVQRDGMVLTDSLDVVSRYEPILVI